MQTTGTNAKEWWTHFDDVYTLGKTDIAGLRLVASYNEMPKYTQKCLTRIN